jgi:hypothetical protein
MFPIDAPGPASGKFVLQRFRLSETRKRFTLDLPDQANYTKSLRSILRHPPLKILETGLVKFQASQ